VLAVIKRELRGRTPTPALLADIEPIYRAVVPECIAIIRHLPRIPGGRRMAKTRYELTIRGPRVDGKWTFTNGWLIRHFEDVA
jgi:hypothetical protein